jgi:hypothetical protein
VARLRRRKARSELLTCDDDKWRIFGWLNVSKVDTTLGHTGVELLHLPFEHLPAEEMINEDDGQGSVCW